MATIKLFDRVVTITRTTSKGYTNDDYEYVAGDTTDIPVECNIQPYREGLNSFNDPTGYRTRGGIKVYVPEEFILQAADEDTGIVGDQLIYKGKDYFCKDLEVWDLQSQGGVSLIPSHNLGYFYKKDKS